MFWILLLTTLSRVMHGHHEEPPTELPTELECAYLATRAYPWHGWHRLRAGRGYGRAAGYVRRFTAQDAH
jgi:hypothetical protein